MKGGDEKTSGGKRRFVRIILLCALGALVAGGAIYAAVSGPKGDRKYKKIPSPADPSGFAVKKRPLVSNADIYVDANGSDENGGSFEAPVKTIAGAQALARKLVESGKGATVAIKAGEYNESGIKFGKEDSGTENARVVYTAYGDGEAIVNGGTVLRAEDFEDVSGEAAGRIAEKAAGKVKTLDLSQYGLSVKDYGKIKATGAFNTEEYYDGAADFRECELFVDSERATLARYPDEGFLRLGGILDAGDCYEPNPPGPTDESWTERRNKRGGTFDMDDETYNRVKNWKTTKDAWIFGYFYWDWADASSPIKKIDGKRLTTEYCSIYGFKEGGTYYFYNVLEELDSPGEYYIDRDKNVLYLYPPGNLEKAEIVLSVADEPIFSFDENARNIELNGLTLMGTRGDGISMAGENCSLTDCVVKNVAGSGARVKGRNNLVQRCEIFAAGKDGVVLSGGDLETSGAANNVVDNNSIHDFGRLQKTYIAGVNLSGAGNRVSHNEIYNAPHAGILYSGNDHIMEYNIIRDAVLQSSDAGAIYTGYSFRSYGNVIRYNRISDLGSEGFTPNGIYFDDNSSGQSAYGNVLINIPGRAFLVGGGRDEIIRDNLIINAGIGIHYDDRAYDGYHNGGWYAKNCAEPDGGFWLKMREAKEFNDKIGNRYAGIDRMNQNYDDEDAEGFAVNPAGSVVKGNAVIGCVDKATDFAESVCRYSDARGNSVYKLKKADKFFADAQNGDYNFSENSKLTADNPALKKIELDKMGRYRPPD